MWPVAQDRLVLKLMDEDKVVGISSDEVIGSIPLSLKDIVKNHSTEKGTLMWKQLYGAPVDSSGEAATAMNENPELASDWKGRVLMHLQACDAQYPEFNVVDASEELLALCKEQKCYEPRKFELIFEVGAGICLPQTDGGGLFSGNKSKKEGIKYRVRVQVGDFSLRTKDPRQSKHAYNRWGERLEDTFESPCSSVERLGYVFVYLEDSNQVPICFWKGEAKDYCHDYVNSFPQY